MTEQESKSLIVGDNVFFAHDMGAVMEKTETGVRIAWPGGHDSWVHHQGMGAFDWAGDEEVLRARVERAKGRGPAK